MLDWVYLNNNSCFSWKTSLMTEKNVLTKSFSTQKLSGKTNWFLVMNLYKHVLGQKISFFLFYLFKIFSNLNSVIVTTWSLFIFYRYIVLKDFLKCITYSSNYSIYIPSTTFSRVNFVFTWKNALLFS